MSWSRLSKLFEKKVMDEVGKQLDLDISGDGRVSVRSLKRCKFCGNAMSAADVFCPKCERSQE